MAEQSGVLVTGAGGRIGNGIARMFAARGERLVISDLDPERLESTRQACQPLGGQVSVVAADVSDEQAIERLVAETVATVGTIGILVNCAGIFPNTPVEKMETTEWDRVFAINVRGPFLLSRAVARHMIAHKLGGSIVNISSSAGQSARTGGAHYCGSKAALDMLTRTMAIELGPHRIRVNGVAPGLVMSDVLTQPLPADTHPYVRSLVAGIPLGRTGDPGDIANAVAFLCSDEAAWISGEILGVNGGSMAGRTHLPPSSTS
ncbi:MAG: SDR family oxidoreductase [Chloroflexota bacterium]|nr:SDR family oxidoreductase [Chloroflexota bacterium]